MKFFKYSVLALAFAAAFSACDDETYTPGAPSEGVYILTDNPTAVELDRNENSFEVKVARSGESAAATYALIGSASDEEAFTLPASVSFAEGETETTVSIAYNQALMAMDKAYKVMIAFPSEVTVSDYGYRSLEMAVTLPAPWVTIGKGTYQDLYVFPSYWTLNSGGYLSYECELQQHEIDKTRFRWLHPYGDNFAKACAAVGLDLEPSQYDSQNKYSFEFISADKEHVLVPYQAVGFTVDEEDGPLYVGNTAGMYYVMGGYPFDVLIANYPEFFGTMTWGKDKDEDGKEIDVVETMFQGPGLTCLNFDPNADTWYTLTNDPGGYNWWAEGVEIKDYDVTLKYVGVLSDADGYSKVLADVTLGEDLKSAKVGLVKTTDLEAAIEAVASDEVEVLELTESVAKQEFSYDGSDDYVLAAIGYNEEGEEVSSATLKFFVADAGNSEWAPVTTESLMVDGYVLPAYSIGGVRVDPMDYAFTVRVDKNTANPGVYRVVAPYTSESFPLLDNNGNTTEKYNLVFDARDPEFVTMVPQCTGYLWSNGKYLWASSIADYFIAKGNTQEQIIGAEFNNVLEDEIICITIPTVQFFAPGTTDVPADQVAGSFYEDDEDPCPTLIVLDSSILGSAPQKVAMKRLEQTVKARTTNAKLHRAAKMLTAGKVAKVRSISAKTKSVAF